MVLDPRAWLLWCAMLALAPAAAGAPPRAPRARLPPPGPP